MEYRKLLKESICIFKKVMNFPKILLNFFFDDLKFDSFNRNVNIIIIIIIIRIISI